MPTVRPGCSRTLRDREQHPGDERRAVEAVVPDGQRLALGAEQHLLVRDEPGEPDRVHRDAVDVGAAGAVESGAGGIGVGRHAFSSLGDESGGAGRGARRRVGLVRVVQFDDFDRFEEPRGLLGEMHGQHRADGEVRRDEHRRRRAWRPASLDLLEALVGETGGADDGVDPVVDQELQVVHHDVGVGEVDDDLGVRCRSTRLSASPASTRPRT